MVSTFAESVAKALNYNHPNNHGDSSPRITWESVVIDMADLIVSNNMGDVREFLTLAMPEKESHWIDHIIKEHFSLTGG